MKTKRIISLLIVGILAVMPLSAARGWENITPPRIAMERIDAEDCDFSVRDGYIYITTSRTVQVKVFTILGQTIIQSSLSPGSYRFKLGAKGIYLIKIGTATRRITV